MYDFGLRLKELRTQRGLTQKSLAKRINRSKAAIGSYESNRQMPPLDVLISIASALNVSLDYLVGFEKSAYLSTKGLDDSQAKVIEMILAEFADPSGEGDVFSSQQLDIIRKLILIFEKSNTTRSAAKHQ